MPDAQKNTFLDAPLWQTYARTALPIIFVMSMNGFLTVADAMFLGYFVGDEALAAVTLMFPLSMILIALSTLVSGGMSSILARHLGGQKFSDARAVFVGAHGIAVTLGILLIGLFLLFGTQVVEIAAAGSEQLAELGYLYLQITVLFCPLLFLLSVNSDALRCEGRVGFMAAMSLLVSIANIAFNYVLIAIFELGVAGSAYGTVMAQLLAFGIIAVFRSFGNTQLKASILFSYRWKHAWGEIVSLGAPQSLNFFGLSLGSTAIIIALQMVGTSQYDVSVSAYGIVTRVFTFVFLPLLGLSHAMQTITGNNFGALRFDRSNKSLRFALWSALIYCAIAQLGFIQFRETIGQLFVDDPVIIAEVARILPIMSLTFFISGPTMIIAMHFQAIGQAIHAAVLGLSKPYLFALPLTFILANAFGEIGIWLAGPLSDLFLLGLTAVLLSRLAKTKSLRFGIFETVKEPYHQQLSVKSV